jgi:hypothetical protein
MIGIRCGTSKVARRTVGVGGQRSDDRLDVDTDALAAADIGQERLDLLVIDELLSGRLYGLCLAATAGRLLLERGDLLGQRLEAIKLGQRLVDRGLLCRGEFLALAQRFRCLGGEVLHLRQRRLGVGRQLLELGRADLVGGAVVAVLAAELGPLMGTDRHGQCTAGKRQHLHRFCHVLSPDQRVGSRKSATAAERISTPSFVASPSASRRSSSCRP